jgi:membrane glycosyltransferase
LETLLYTLIAPVLMLFHTKFVVLTLCRRSVGWKTQRRGRDGESDWRESAATHAGQTALGFAWLALAWWINPTLALWMSPILAGFILSIPLSFFTGRTAPGLGLKRAHILLTPEESAPLPELNRVRECVAERADEPALPSVTDGGLLEAVTDPCINAIHVSQLRTRENPAPANEPRFATLRARLLHEGPASLTPREKLALMLDADSMTRLHRDLWSTPATKLAAEWQRALEDQPGTAGMEFSTNDGVLAVK